MKIVVALGLVSFVAVLVPVGCLYLERPSRYYESHNDALYGGNWVPRIFPSDIREIYEQHDLDTNEVWLRFREGANEFHPQAHGFVEIPSSELQEVRSSSPFWAGWWFDRGEEYPGHKLYRGGGCYRQRDAGGKVAFILETAQHYYWWCQYP